MNNLERKQFLEDLFHTWMRRALYAEEQLAKAQQRIAELEQLTTHTETTAK